MSVRSWVARRARRLALALVLVSSAGCHHEPDAETVKRLMQFLLTLEAIDSQRQRASRAFSHFANRRIKWLVGQNSGWGNESPNYPSLTQRVTSELNEVIHYLDDKLGTPQAPGPLGGGTDANALPHIDLADAARVYSSDNADDEAVKTRARDFLAARRTAVEAIVWRAAALHHELWNGSDSSTTTTINRPALEELLDRRLHAVERLHLSDQSIAKSRAWTLASAGSGWLDGRRTILFQYPFIALAKDRKDPFSQAAAAANIPLETIPGFTVNDRLDELRFNQVVHFRASVSANWVVDPSDDDKFRFMLSLGAGDTAAAVLDKMLPPTSPIDAAFTDFWNRSWLFCDHNASLVHATSLRLGLRRRTGNDNEFNGAAAGHFYLRPLIGTSSVDSPNDLIAGGKKYFEATSVDPADLQVGDHIIFWNSYFMRSVMGSDFGLENALVGDAAADGNALQLSFLGHGMELATLANFKKQMFDDIANIFDALRRLIVQKQPAIYIPLKTFPIALMQWAPYGEVFKPADGNQMQVPGAWWIRIKLKDTRVGTGPGSTPALSLSEALSAFPRSIAIDISKMTPPNSQIPDHAADWKDSIYLPLSVPNGVRNGWEQYLKDNDNDSAGFEVKLDDLRPDSSFILGLFFKGSQSKVPVFRPKVIP